MLFLYASRAILSFLCNRINLKIGGFHAGLSITDQTGRGLPTMPDLSAIRPSADGRPEHSHKRRLWSFLLYRKFLLNHELCKQIALQKQGTENRRLRLEDIKTFFSKIVIVDIIKFM